MIIVTVILALAFCGGLSSASIIEGRLTPGNTSRFLYSNFGVLFFLYYFVSLVPSPQSDAATFLGPLVGDIDDSNPFRIGQCALALTVLPPNKFPEIVAQTTATISITMSTIFTATAAWLLRPHGYHRGKKPLRNVDLELELAKLQAGIADWLDRHKEPISAHVPLLRWQVADIVTTVGACVMEDRKFEYPVAPGDATAAAKGSSSTSASSSSSSSSAASSPPSEGAGETVICRKVHESSVCCICLEHISYYDSDVAVLARCGHAFHFVCLESWLRMRNQCAVCRAVAV